MSNKMGISAVILVGRSTRMGRDKALLELGHQTFISRLAQELSICDEVFVSGPSGRDYSGYGLKMVEDECQGIGPIEGIRQSLRHAAADHVFVCACDMPFVRREMILYLAGFLTSDYEAYVFRNEGRIHPLCGIYNRTVLPVAGEMIAAGKYRMMELLSAVRTRYVDFAGSGLAGEMLANINTPEEYAKIMCYYSRPICNQVLAHHACMNETGSDCR